ncbi:MAG: SusC/RagA family TonB-linked outer membrane protein, partial [Chitinophagales bacterium]|nr:SusC/RagA family TonB-linked outer membrane protein [Chitinophagales bacterium]
GTTIGTVTDIDGKYTLELPKEVTTLVFSYIGYTNVEKPILTLKINADMTAEGQMLEDVVVTALATKRNKSAVVYANQSVKGEELNTVTNKSALNALQGKVAGIKITQSSGAPGASTRVVLRGETSITGNNNALIIVDGVQLDNSTSSAGGGTGTNGDRDNYVDFGNRGNDINPDDIESITVLKGPAATTLYGSRGSAGVILITTKKGKAPKEGKPFKVSIGTSLSFEKPYILFKKQDKFGSGYKSCNGCGGDVDIFMGENYAWGAEFDGVERPWTAIPVDEDGNILPLTNGKIEQLSRPYSYIKNHMSTFFNTGFTHRTNVNIEGGSDKYSYFTSYTNFNNTGVIPNTFYKKHNVLLNASANFSEKFNANFSVNYTKLNQRGATEGAYPFGYTGPIPIYSFALQTPGNIPFTEMRDYNSPYQDFNGFYAQYSVNPYYFLDKSEVTNNVDNVLGSVALSYKPIKDITLTTRVGNNFSISRVIEKYPKYQYNRALSWSDGELSDFNSPRSDGNFSLGSFAESTSKVNVLTIDALASYNKEFKKKVTLDATVGFNSFSRSTNVLSGTTVGGLVVPEFYDLSNSVSPAQAASATSNYRIVGLYLNTSLGYRRTLFLEYSLRNDWSSTLPVKNRSYLYQSGGVSFVPTELFKKPNKYLSYLKVRANVGTTGKDAGLYLLNSYFSLNPTILSYSSDYEIQLPFDGASGAVKSSTIGNPALKPELTITYEAGADVGLFNDHLNIEYTYYYSNSKNQIILANLPNSSGYSFSPLNVGRMTNRGHELAVNAKVLKNKLINWSVFFTFNKNKNRVEKIADGLSELAIYSGIVHFGGHGSLNLVAKEGEPFGTYKGTSYQYDNQGRIIVDGSGAPKLASDLTYHGSYQPKFQTSWGTDFSIKGLTAHVLFDARIGGTFASNTKLSTEFNGTAYTTLLNNRQDFVVPNSVQETSPGSGEYVENTTPVTVYNYFKNAPASTMLLDATFIKLREATLSYSLPSKLFQNLPISGISVGIFGKNLKTWTAKENTFADPEVSGVGGASNAQGLETSTTPTSRSVGIEFKLNF